MILHTWNSIYQIDFLNKRFRRLQCDRGKPRPFDDCWTDYIECSVGASSAPETIEGRKIIFATGDYKTSIGTSVVLCAFYENEL